jgi:hypothetical protein
MTKKAARRRPGLRVPKAASGGAELTALRRAHSLDAQIEIRERIAQETVRALQWQADRAARRIAGVTVGATERSSHAAAALELGRAERLLLNLIARRRLLRLEIRVRTRRLQARRAR